MTVVGYSMLDGQVKSNSALLVLTLKPFAERTLLRLGHAHETATGLTRRTPDLAALFN